MFSRAAVRGANRFALVPVRAADRSGMFGILRGQIHYADDIIDMFEGR